MGVLDTVYKKTELVPNQQAEVFLTEGAELEELGKIQSAKLKYMEAIHAFRVILTNRPHDTVAREGVIKCWKKLSGLYVNTHLYTLPTQVTCETRKANRSIGFSLIKTVLVDAFVEKDWQKQCEGKYGGPKPLNVSWKTFYFNNEAAYDCLQQDDDKLIWSVKNGHACLLKYLLQNKEKSMDINKVMPIQSNETLLEIAVKYDYIQVAQLLIDYGIKVNTKGTLKWTPLHWAIQTGNLAMVQLLVTQGARINIKEKNGLMPLHIAALNGYNEIISYLIEKKAKINVLSETYHFSPLQLAVYNNHPYCVAQLINHNADIKRVDEFKRTLLHWAAANGKGDLIDLLVKGIPVNTVDDIGRTPLHWAAQNGDSEIIKTLISYKSKTTLKDKFGDTPLKIAAFLGHPRDVLLLFEHSLL